MTGDNWAVTPETDDDLLFASGAVAGAGALTLLRTTTGENGVGYKILFTSAGDSSARTWTIVGHAMGTDPGVSTSETVTAPNATTASSTNYYDRITSITASGAMTGNQKVGILGTSVALPRTRVQFVYFVASGSAGSIVVNLNSTTGRQLLKVATPASATGTDSMHCPGSGILTTGGGVNDFGLVTLTNVTSATLVCG